MTVCKVYKRHDVTKEKLAADEVSAAGRDLTKALSARQAIFDNSLDVITALEGDGVFTKVSRHGQEVWGYRPEEMVGRNYAEFLHPDDLDAALRSSPR